LEKVDLVVFDLAFVDFFLTKDGRYGTEILDRIAAKTLVGFSSTMFGSQAIKEEADKSGFGRTKTILKIKESVENPELQILLQEFLEQAIGS
jgi:hypothetical protein